MIVPRRLFPVTNRIPVHLEVGFGLRAFLQSGLDTRDTEQLVQAVRIEVVDYCLVRNFILLKLPRRTRLQPAFRGIPEQVIRGGPTSPREEHLCIRNACVRQQLKVRPVHIVRFSAKRRQAEKNFCA